MPLGPGVRYRCRKGSNVAETMMALRRSLDLAYLAGFLDGEGFIGLHARADPKRRTPGHSVIVTITNTKKASLDLFVAYFGGQTRLKLRLRQNPKHRPVWTLTLQGHRAVDAIRQLRPYIRLKSEQADLALAYARTLRNVGRRGHGVELVAHRLRLVGKVRQLNQRGVNAA